MTSAERKRRFLETQASRPEPPMALDEIAMREWRRLAGVLRERNVLHEIDHGSLAAYCQMYSRWVAAEKALALMAELNPMAGGLLIKTSDQPPAARAACGDVWRRFRLLVGWSILPGRRLWARSEQLQCPLR
jgi:phage terminase small subunit